MPPVIALHAVPRTYGTGPAAVSAFHATDLDIGEGGRSVTASVRAQVTGLNLLAFAFAGLLGAFFGFAPARRAATLNPIDALRHE